MNNPQFICQPSFLVVASLSPVLSARTIFVANGFDRERAVISRTGNKQDERCDY